MSRLIDADSLVRNIKKWEKYIGKYEKDIPYDEDIYVSIMMTIEDEPTVDAVPIRHGRWKYDENGMDWNIPAWVCSECRFRNDMIPTHVKGVNGSVEFQNPLSWSGSRYCANCGARMDGEREEE